MWHVVLVQALDVEADIVAWVRKIDARVVHLDCEDLANTWIGGCVRGQKDDLLTWLDNTLLHTASKDITDALDLVDTRDGHAHWGADRALRDTADDVKHIEDSVDV